jgi:hypothetical protein
MEDFTLPSVGATSKIGEETFKGLFSNLFLPVAHLFGLMWLTHAGWFQHFPALPQLLSKFSFPHNFWFIGSRIIKIVFLIPYSKAHVHKKKLT